MSRNPERDRAIAADYRAGVLQPELQQRYGLSSGRISQIITAQGQNLSRQALAARHAVANRKRANDPAYRAKMREATRRVWAEGRAWSTKLRFESEEQRRLYNKFKKSLGAAAARRELGL